MAVKLLLYGLESIFLHITKLKSNPHAVFNFFVVY